MAEKTFRGIRPTDPNGRNGLRNPDRGFRFEIRVAEHEEDGLPDPICPQWPFAKYAADGITIAQAYCYLSGSVGSRISRKKLDDLQAAFDKARHDGVKFLLRFAYEWDEAKVGPTCEQLLEHMDQLKDIIRRNIDVIYVLQSGWIGLWGEWHTSIHGLEKDLKLSSQIVKKAVDILPEGRFTMMRRGKYKIQNLTQLGLFKTIDESTAFTSAFHARIGFFNDGTFANATDGGTFPDAPYFASKGNPEFDYVCKEAPYMPVDGEMFWTGQFCKRGVDPFVAAQRFRDHHYTTFSYVHGFSGLDMKQGVEFTIDDWKKENIFEDELIKRNLPVSADYFSGSPRTSFEYFRDHLGYRVELTGGSWNSEVRRGGEFKLDLSLVNRGFATFINPRTAYIVIFNQAGDCIEIPTGADCRKWQPYKPEDDSYTTLTHSVSASLKIPDSVSAGTWQAALWLPDCENSLKYRADYAVRTANGDVEWKDLSGRGCNILGEFKVL